MNTDHPWGSHRGAVSLTFDDGTRNQLDLAVPALDERGLRGTFYIAPKQADWEQRYAPWRAVAARGHEIGNHTLSHPCPASVTGSMKGYDTLTLEALERDILAARERLRTIAPGQEEWTFAYPCYCTEVGRGATRQSYVPLIAKHFLAGRAGGEFGFGNHPAAVDLACVAGLATDRMSGAEMIGLVESLVACQLWVVLVFHEISGDRLTVGAYDYRLLLDHLQRRESEIWTAPLVEVGRTVRAFQQKA